MKNYVNKKIINMLIFQLIWNINVNKYLKSHNYDFFYNSSSFKQLYFLKEINL